MSKYKNKKTGAVLEITCKVPNKNWEKVTTKKNSKKTGKTKCDEQLESVEPEV